MRLTIYNRLQMRLIGGKTRGCYTSYHQPMLVRLIIFVLCLIVFASAVYFFVTRITFKDQKGHVSSLYCKLIGSRSFSTRPIIFIPGVKGSLLSQDGKYVWLRLWQTMFKTDPFFFDPNERQVMPFGILTRLSFLPGIVEYAPYQRISAYLACHPNAYFFSYDWRRNPSDHLTALHELVERVRKETGEKPAIIAHSMGGLITHGYLKTYANTIDKVAYVGVPFQPGIGFVEDLEKGSAVGLNKTILSKEAVFSQPSTFSLLPHKGQRLYKQQDLMEVETWTRNRLSVFKDGTSLEPQLRQRLADAVAFQTVLDSPTPLPHSFLFVVGNCHSTIYALQEDGSYSYVPGDGRVPEQAMYPVGYEELQTETFVSCATHDQQMNDKEITDRILTFLR